MVEISIADVHREEHHPDIKWLACEDILRIPTVSGEVFLSSWLMSVASAGLRYVGACAFP